MERPFRFGPVALSATLTTNILNPGTTTGGVGMGSAYANLRILLTKIRIVNKTSGAVTASLWLGATGSNTAGTEVLSAHSVPANSEYEMFCELPMDTADFLVGGASAGTSLTIQGEGIIGVA